MIPINFDPTQITPAISLLTLFADVCNNNNIKNLITNINKSKGIDFVKYFTEKLRNYINDTKQELNSFRTYLYDENEATFNDIYYPMFIKNNSSSFYPRHIKIDDDNIKKLFNRNTKITITGDAGSGKTMVSKKIFFAAAENNYSIPIRILFRNINSEEQIFDYILTKLLKLDSYIIENKELLNYIFESGIFLFIFDGFDENKRILYKSRMNEIMDFSKKFKSNKYVITSRNGTKIEYLKGFSAFQICQLDEKEISPFIDRQCKSQNIAKHLKEELEDEDVKKKYYDYLKNPLLLTLFIYTYQYYKNIPEKRSDFYRYVFNTLWMRHDYISKGPEFEREKYFNDQDFYEKILGEFSLQTFSRESYSFEEDELLRYLEKTINDLKFQKICNSKNIKEDLVTSISILFKDGNSYIFPHRTMQEYFIAKYVSGGLDVSKANFYDKLINLVLNNYDFSDLLTFLFEIDTFSFYTYYIKKILTRLINDIKEFISPSPIYLRTNKHKANRKRKPTKKHIIVQCDFIDNTNVLLLESDQVFKSIIIIMKIFDQGIKNEIQLTFSDKRKKISQMLEPNIIVNESECKNYFIKMQELTKRIVHIVDSILKEEETRCNFAKALSAFPVS